MKYYNMRPLFYHLLLFLFLLNGCTSQKSDFVIGVSQCSEDEWREQMNKEICREALFYSDVEVRILSAKDDNARQIADIESFIEQNVDLLIVAPNEADAIAPVIEKAYNKGIPVVLVDRKVHSDKYTAFVGADNYEIGQRIGYYIVGRLHGKGQVVELSGLYGSSPAEDRHQGMVDVLKEQSGIHLLSSVDAGWLRLSAEHVFDSILACTPHIDLVFAHNDRMAAGAYQAAMKRNREHEMLFVGIDALAGEGYGVEQVESGQLDATFIYPTGGDKVMQVAMKILKGEDFLRETKLSTALVNKDNVRIMEMQTEHVAQLDDKIEFLNEQIDKYLMRFSMQRMFLLACVVIIILISAFLFFIVRAFRMKNRLNKKLAGKKEQLENQRDQLVRLSTQLEQTTRAKLVFFTNVSHDFRTPLTLIADPVHELASSEKLGDRERYLLNVIGKNVTILLRLVNQILDFRKFEEGKLQLHLSSFDIAVEIKKWTDNFRSLAYRKHIHFVVDVIPSGEGYAMIADVEKMERITYNLLSNAFKYTSEGGEVQIILSQFQKGEETYLCYQVVDSGIGLSQEHIQHVFDSFYQVDVHQGGSGIGLSLTKAFVEMHKGHITVDSEEKRGTKFTIEMPMRQAGVLSEDIGQNDSVMNNLKNGAVLSADQDTIQVLNEPVIVTSKETLLVVDDNQEVRNYIKFILSDTYTIIEASNGKEGVDQAIKYVPDLVICDVMMPVMDGMECCKHLKTELQTSHIPVIMLTACALDEQKIQGYTCGADSYISKPFNAQMLKVRVRNLLDNRYRIQSVFSDNIVLQKESITEVDKCFVEKLRDLINTYLGDPDLSVEELGGKIGMGRVQLYRKTKALTGHSPNELIRIARLKKAASLLNSTDKTIAEITYEVGFNAPSYFTKCYKDFFGESPTEFLKRKGRKN